MIAFKVWFTLERRQGIQLLAASIVPLLVLFGFGTEETWTQWLIILAGLLQFVSNLLSLLNLKAGMWTEGYTIFRGALYGIAAIAAPALIQLGFLSEELGGQILAGVAVSLSVLGNMIAVLVGGQQKTEELEIAVTELTQLER